MDEKIAMEEEISLMDIIEVLVKRKKLIFIIVFLAVILSGGGMFIFRILGPTIYEATTTVIVSPLTPPPLEGETAYNVLVDYLSQYPQLTNDFYLSQVKNPHIIYRIIEELDLDKTQYDFESLKERFHADFVSNTNIIELRVQDKNPEMAARIANSWANQFTAFISDAIEKQMSKSVAFIENQMKEGEKQLEVALEDLKSFLSHPPSVEELQQEIDAKTTLLTDYKKNLVELDTRLQNLEASREIYHKQMPEETFQRLFATLTAQPRNAEELQQEIDAKTTLLTDYKKNLVELDIREKRERASLSKIKEMLAAELPFWTLKKSLADSSEFFGYAAGRSNVPDIARLTLESQEINQNYITLSARLSELQTLLESIVATRKETEGKIDPIQNEINALQILLIDRQLDKLRENRRVLTENIISLQTDINEKRTTLVPKQSQLDTLKQQYELAKSNYSTFFTKCQELKVATSTRIGEMNITVLSEALIPQKPAPSRYSLKLTVAIGLVVGFFLAILIAFFAEFWQKYQVYQKEKG